jgi:hypothetical protein
VDTGDWLIDSPAAVIEQLPRGGERRGDHQREYEGKGGSAEALPAIVRDFKERASRWSR